MSTEIAITDPNASIHAQMEFARMAAGSTDQRDMARSILPEEYRGNPANILIATGLGESMGLSFAESLYRIHVIKGKPSAAAELIASNVRKAGHKLRIKVSENPPEATCTIIRADDPDEPTVIVRDMAWAQRMGLAKEPNYIKQPATMLANRAVTACARLACPEALYGVTYAPDELSAPDDVAPSAESKPTGLSAIKAAAQATAPTPDVEDAVIVNEQTGEITDPEQPVKIPTRERNRLFAMLAQKAIGDENQQRAFMASVLDRTVEHRDVLTRDEYQRLVSELDSYPDADPEQPALGEDGAA